MESSVKGRDKSGIGLEDEHSNSSLRRRQVSYCSLKLKIYWFNPIYLALVCSSDDRPHHKHQSWYLAQTDPLKLSHVMLHLKKNKKNVRIKNENVFKIFRGKHDHRHHRHPIQDQILSTGHIFKRIEGGKISRL